jgi:hypothetical protein
MRREGGRPVPESYVAELQRHGASPTLLRSARGHRDRGVLLSLGSAVATVVAVFVGAGVGIVTAAEPDSPAGSPSWYADAPTPSHGPPVAAPTGTVRPTASSAPRPGSGTDRMTRDPRAGPSLGGPPRPPTPSAAGPPVLLGVGRVDPSPLYQDCETGYQFDFTQQISMTRPGRVTYRWLRSDGAGAPVEYIDFAARGTKIATAGWMRGGNPGDTLDGWEQIEILTPVRLRGERIAFSYTCPSAGGGGSP